MIHEVISQCRMAVIAAGQRVGGVELHAVAGAQHDASFEARQSTYLLHGLGHLRFWERETLTHLDGRGFVVQAHTDKAAMVVSRLRHASRSRAR